MIDSSAGWLPLAIECRTQEERGGRRNVPMTWVTVGSLVTSWGDFAHFVAYTRTMTTFLPAGLAAPLAVLATVAEITLGVALLLGMRLRLAALGSAVLLAIYAVCMTITLPLAQQFHYTVFVLATCMLTLATLDGTPLTLDTPRHSRHLVSTRC